MLPGPVQVDLRARVGGAVGDGQAAEPILAEPLELLAGIGFVIGHGKRHLEPQSPGGILQCRGDGLAG